MLNEKDILQEELEQQMHISTSLQLQLNENDKRVDAYRKETTSSYDSKIYQLEHEISKLNEKLFNSNKIVKELNCIVEQAKKQQSLNKENDNSNELKSEICVSIMYINILSKLFFFNFLISIL